MKEQKVNATLEDFNLLMHAANGTYFFNPRNIVIVKEEMYGLPYTTLVSKNMKGNMDTKLIKTGKDITIYLKNPIESRLKLNIEEHICFSIPKSFQKNSGF